MGDGGLFDPGEGVRVETVFQQVRLEVFQDLNGFVDVIAIQVSVEAHEADAAEHFAFGPRPVGQTVVQADLPVQRPVEVILEDIEGLVVLIVQHRLRHQPVQLGAVTHEAAGEGALVGGAGADVRQRTVLAGFDRFEGAPRAFQISRQQFVEFADDDQGHVVRRVPGLAHLL